MTAVGRELPILGDQDRSFAQRLANVGSLSGTGHSTGFVRTAAMAEDPHYANNNRQHVGQSRP